MASVYFFKGTPDGGFAVAPLTRALGCRVRTMAHSVPFRVVLSQNGIRRKFFTLFQGRDGSLYIHPNRDTKKPWRIPKLENSKDGLSIDLNNYSEPNFEPHKISFHPSGYIHITNKKGERYKDGTKGPAFDEMDTLYLFGLIAPTKLDGMPIFKSDPKCMLVDLVLPNDVPPFVMSLAIAKEHPGAAENDGTLITNRFVLPLNAGRYFVFLLRAVVPKSQGEDIRWPSFPLFLMRTAA